MSETQPASIFSAICAVTSAIGKLSKANVNKFDNYSFTSIDDFMAATSGPCAEHGLVVVQNETKLDVIEKKGKSWLLMAFEFTVHHTGGESIGPFKRSVSVPFTGAQAFGSGQSYALKQFLRSLFQIATGDADDPDYHRPEAPESLPTQEVTQIQDVTIQALLDESDKHPAFESQDVFRDWIRETCEAEIGALQEHQGQRVLQFLRGKGADMNKWGDEHLNALTKVLGKEEGK